MYLRMHSFMYLFLYLFIDCQLHSKLGLDLCL